MIYPKRFQYDLIHIIIRYAMIDEETRRIINEFLDEIGAPRSAHERAFTDIIREAVVFSLKGCKRAFLTQLGEWSEIA